MFCKVLFIHQLYMKVTVFLYFYQLNLLVVLSNLKFLLSWNFFPVTFVTSLQRDYRMLITTVLIASALPLVFHLFGLSIYHLQNYILKNSSNRVVFSFWITSSPDLCIRTPLYLKIIELLFRYMYHIWN